MAQMRLDTSSYISDIDGLRALAVLGVLVFHLYPSFLPGGYLGVDVFFVISGYLITKKISEEMKQDRFSLLTFYQRRMKRILPACFVVVGATLVAGFFLLLPSDLVDLARSAASTTFFSANWYFAQRYDYFSADTSLLPLLHTWSLAVEEQFYFVWPLVLLLLIRGRQRVWILPAGVGALFFISLGLGLYWEFLPGWGQQSFFSTWSRSYELLIGAALALAPISSAKSRNSGQLITGLAILTIVGCYFIFHEDMVAARAWALVPCIATASIIAESRAHPWLVNSMAVHLGQLSYSIYLWHWPILAFLRYTKGPDLNIATILVAVVSTYLLALGSYLWVENPVRKSQLTWKQAALACWLFPSFLILALQGSIEKTNGWPQRYGLRAGQLMAERHYLDDHYCHGKISGNCVLGNPNGPTRVFLVGDSNAGHFMPFWDEIAKSLSIRLEARSANLCFPVFKAEDAVSPHKHDARVSAKQTDYCKAIMEWLDQELKKDDLVILASDWRFHLDDQLHPTNLAEMMKTALHIQNRSRGVLLMETVPQFDKSAFRRLVRQRHPVFSGSTSDNLSLVPVQPERVLTLRLKGAGADSLATHVVEVNEEIRRSLSFPTIDGHLLYKDETHLNQEGAKRLAHQMINRNGDLIVKIKSLMAQ